MMKKVVVLKHVLLVILLSACITSCSENTNEQSVKPEKSSTNNALSKFAQTCAHFETKLDDLKEKRKREKYKEFVDEDLLKEIAKEGSGIIDQYEAEIEGNSKKLIGEYLTFKQMVGNEELTIDSLKITQMECNSKGCCYVKLEFKLNALKELEGNALVFSFVCGKYIDMGVGLDGPKYNYRRGHYMESGTKGVGSVDMLVSSLTDLSKEGIQFVSYKKGQELKEALAMKK